MERTEELITALDMVKKKRKIEVIHRKSKLPFYKELQLKKNKSQLQRMESMQKWTFERLCKKDKIHKEDWEEEFILYWCGFLKGEYKSINQYLKRRNYGV